MVSVSVSVRGDWLVMQFVGVIEADFKIVRGRFQNKNFGPNSK